MKLEYDDWKSCVSYASRDVMNDVLAKEGTSEEKPNFYVSLMKEEKTDFGYACKMLLKTDPDQDHYNSRLKIKCLIKSEMCDFLCMNYNSILLEKLTSEVLDTYTTNVSDRVSNLPNNTTYPVTDDITQTLTQII